MKCVEKEILEELNNYFVKYRSISKKEFVNMQHNIWEKHKKALDPKGKGK